MVVINKKKNFTGGVAQIEISGTRAQLKKVLTRRWRGKTNFECTQRKAGCSGSGLVQLGDEKYGILSGLKYLAQKPQPNLECHGCISK